jgi:hypothetical protein
LWVATDAENAARVDQAIRDFGFGNLFDAHDFSKPGYAVQLGRPPYRIDILTSIQGVDFAEAYARRKNVTKNGVKLPFIGLDELLINKRTAGRTQDLVDADKLAASGDRKPSRVKPGGTVKSKKRK